MGPPTPAWVEKLFGNPGSTEMYAQSTCKATLVNLHTAAGVGNGAGAIVNAEAASPGVTKAGGLNTRVCL